jgi:hypothetical protein
MTYTWANPEHIGVITVVDGRVVYLDGGPEYEAAVAAGPAEYSGPLDVVDPNAPPAPAPTKAEQEAKRKTAYEAEADPLFFMSQRGEATVEEWQAKVAEIKARYPYPEETQA